MSSKPRRSAYVVRWAYRSSLGGPWQAGDTITLTDAEAEAINRDSPGVLEAQTSAPAAPQQHRQVRRGRSGN